MWGGAPAILDMRTGATPMGAIETAMLDAAYAQVGKVARPAHPRLPWRDATRKIVDAQAGLESGMTALVGALAGIDMISGAGMLDCSAARARRSSSSTPRRSRWPSASCAASRPPPRRWRPPCFAAAGPEGRFLELPETRRLFRSEQHLPVDGDRPRLAAAPGSRPAGGDAFGRARARVDELLAAYRRPAIDPAVEAAMVALARREADRVGMAELPGVPE